MKKTLKLIAALLCGTATLSASQPEVNVRSELQPDNSLSIVADVKGHGTVTVVLELLSAENYSLEGAIPIRRELRNGTSEVVRLIPIDPEKPVSADYDFNWVQGKVNPGIAAGFIYRLPFADGIATVPREVSTHEMRLTGRDFRDFKVWEFPLRKGDTVYPVRSGEVIRVEGFENIAGSNTMTGSPMNMIYIEHPDGMISQYTMLDGASLQVSEGQTVYPDTPLAKAGALDLENYGMRLALYYMVPNNSGRRGGITRTAYFDPVFSTTDGNAKLIAGKNVTPKTPKALINKDKANKNFFKRIFCRK